MTSGAQNKGLGVILVIAILVTIAVAGIFQIQEPAFNPPYLAFALQALFVFGASVAVAVVSAGSYLRSGSINLAYLGSALLINGFITTLSVAPIGFSSNTVVTVANLGVLLSSVIQFLGALATFRGASPTGEAGRKKVLVTTYIISALLICGVILAGFSGVFPVLLTPTGPTLLRLIIISSTIVLLFASCFLFSWQYYKTRFTILYWYSLALALFGVALIAAFFTITLGDLMNWASRMAIYLSGVYFLFALLSRSAETGGDTAMSQRWAETFAADRRQSAALFANMLDAFVYAKIVTDGDGKPTDWVFLDVNSAFEQVSGLPRESIVGKKVSDVFPDELVDPSGSIKNYGEVALTGKPVRFESYRAAFGKWLSVSAYRPRKGYFVAILENITERKKAELEIHSLNKRFEMAQQAAGVGVWDWDVKTGHIDWTPEMYRLFGLDPKTTAASFEAWNSILHPEDRQKAGAKIDEALKTHSFLDNEYRVVRPNGEIVWINALGQGEYNSLNEPVRMTGICIDITEHKKVEESLRESWKKYQDLTETTGDFVWEMDAQGRYTYCSPQMERLWGIKPADMIGKTPFDLMPPENREKASKFFMEAGRSPKPFNELEVTSFDGQGNLVFLEINGVPFFDGQGRLLGYRGMTRDVTERKKAEKEIADLAKFPMENPAAVLRMDNAGIILFANPSAYVFLKEWQTEVGMQAPEKVRQMVADALSSGDRIEFEENVGNELFAFLITPIIAEGYVNLYGRNITKRRKAEAKLEEYTKNLEALVQERTKRIATSALYARRLIEASLDPLVTISADGKIMDVNKSTEEATGFSRDQLIGSDFSDYFTEPEKAMAGYRKVFTDGFVKDYHLAIRHKSGTIIDVLYNATVYRNEAGEIEGVFAAARDITERRKLEKQVQDAERLASIGATAGMVGHDIRNPLQAMLGDIYLAKEDLISVPDSREKQDILESLNAIANNVDYVNKIVADLQDYSRPLKPIREEVNLESVLDDLLLKHDIPKNIEATVKISKNAKAITSDSSFVKRIIENLMTNALQAMPSGGSLSISTYRDEGAAVIVVEDSGNGIPEDVKGRLFTPLFTTKSKGQGFGLAVVKRMTEALGGQVSFESELGKGTKFTVRLPQKLVK